LLHSLVYNLYCRLVTSFFFKRHYYLFYYLFYYYLLLILLNIMCNNRPTLAHTAVPVCSLWTLKLIQHPGPVFFQNSSQYHKWVTLQSVLRSAVSRAKTSSIYISHNRRLKQRPLHSERLQVMSTKLQTLLDSVEWASSKHLKSLWVKIDNSSYLNGILQYLLYRWNNIYFLLW